MFLPTSRHYRLPTAELERPDGRQIVYVTRRFIPQPERFVLQQEHLVVAGERPDHLAHRYLGDAEQFWRLCDANAVIDPNELTREPGRRIRITLPEGVPGVAGA
jgi:hypothetical protein